MLSKLHSWDGSLAVVVEEVNHDIGTCGGSGVTASEGLCLTDEQFACFNMH